MEVEGMTTMLRVRCKRHAVVTEEVSGSFVFHTVTHVAERLAHGRCKRYTFS